MNNKIALLLPSRGRPQNLFSLSANVRNTAVGEVEIWVYLDNDERTHYPSSLLGCNIVRGPRIKLSNAWDILARMTDANYLMLAADDITIAPHGWDEMVRDSFPLDDIAFVHGDDGHPELGPTHGVISRKWMDTVGYFTPSYFDAGFVDVWLEEVAQGIGRSVYLPEFKTIHHRPDLVEFKVPGYNPDDQTYTEAHNKIAGLWQTYGSTKADRVSAIVKLSGVING